MRDFLTEPRTIGGFHVAVSDNDLAMGEVNRRPVTGTALVCRVNNRET